MYVLWFPSIDYNTEEVRIVYSFLGIPSREYKNFDAKLTLLTDSYWCYHITVQTAWLLYVLYHFYGLR